MGFRANIVPITYCNMCNMSIITLSVAYISQIDSISRQTLPENYDWAMWVMLITGHRHVSLGIIVDDQLVGYVCAIVPLAMGVDSTTADWHIASIAVLNEYRCRGYGRRLMKEAINAIRAMKPNAYIDLFVRQDNAVAKHLYASMRFIFTKTLNRYYADGTNALVLAIA